MFFHSKIIYNKKSICYNQNSCVSNAFNTTKEVKILNQILSIDNNNNNKKEKVKKTKEAETDAIYEFEYDETMEDE